MNHTKTLDAQDIVKQLHSLKAINDRLDRSVRMWIIEQNKLDMNRSRWDFPETYSHGMMGNN